MKIHFWYTTTAHMDEVVTSTHPICRVEVGGHPCGQRPRWSLAWTYNQSGIPGLGELRAAFLCGRHLDDYAGSIAHEYAGCLTLTPYKETTP